MTELFAVVLGKDREQVTEALLREGVLQFLSISELDTQGKDNLSTLKPDVSETEISDLRKRIEGILHTIGIIPAAPQETDLNNRIAINIEKENQRLNVIDGERESIRERQRTIQQEILKLEDIRRQVDLYGVDLADITLPTRQSLISMQSGKLPASNVKQLEESLKNLPAMHITLGQQSSEVFHLLLHMKRDSQQINRILASVGWTKVQLPSEQMSAQKDMVKEVTEKIKTLTDEQKKLQSQADNLVKKDEQRLRELWIDLRINELCSRIQTHFKSSSRTVLFAGWLPSSKKEKLEKTITRASEGRCYLEWHDAGSKDVIGEEVPVQFNNPGILAPFQMLVSNFAIPKYGTIDPTPFVMPIYLCMFGLMFADVGQGLVLVLLGLLGIGRFRKNQEKRGLLQLFWLLIWCGSGSILFGALFGSYFGLPLFKPLWFDYHGIISGHVAVSDNSMINDVSDILALTIYFGVSVIILGLLFNWINIIRTGSWMELVFSKGGIMGGWIYGGGIYIVFYMIQHNYKEYPPAMTLFLLAGLPALLLFIKEPYHYFSHKKEHPEKPSKIIFAFLNFIMEWLVELLEIFSGYLSNTLSFMRVAGLGIAHVCLMISFFTLADMTSGIFRILILILGNILVIGLEGLSAAIQALRLNYYEFFTKFFHGTGKLHTPISLNSKL
ncbi:MAG: hypothetical protein JW860_15090 [Sedimentisphaerales bacterium]|nr:hypothetical protein [Sedimentisphaerales bacterium]